MPKELGEMLSKQRKLKGLKLREVEEKNRGFKTDIQIFLKTEKL